MLGFQFVTDLGLWLGEDKGKYEVIGVSNC